jgi:hypothetical protein
MATGRVGNIKSLGVTVEAAFGYDPDDTSPVWTDISTYVMGFSTRRGRKREIDRVTAGSALIRLENPDRRFEGGYTGGAYGSNVVPMTPIRITCTRNAVTYPVFYGFADEWVPSFDPSLPRTAFVDLRATDAFKVIPQSFTIWESEVLSSAPVVWWRLGERKFATTAVDRTGNGFHGTYVGSPKPVEGLVPVEPDEARQLNGAEDGVQRINADVTVAGAMSVEAWVNWQTDDGDLKQNNIASQHNITGLAWALDVKETDSTTLTYIFSHNDGGGGGPQAVVDYGKGTHYVVGTYDGAGTANLYINGALEHTDSTAFYSGTGSSFDGLLVGVTNPILGTDGRWMSGVLDDVAVYDSELDAATILNHYTAATAPRDGELTGARITWLLGAAGWPAGLTDIDAGQALMGPVILDGRATLDLLWEAVEFEDGNLFVARDGDVTFAQRTARYADTTSTVSQATYSYTGSNSKAQGVSFDYSDERLINHAIVNTRTGYIFEAEDATSIGRYLRRTSKVTAPTTDTNTADAFAQWTVQRNKDPKRRITSLKVPTARDTTTFDQTVGLELGYRVTVTLDPPGTGTISEALLVEGIDHDVTPHNWTTTLWCSPDPSPEIVIVGVSLVGGSEVVGY